MLISKFPDGAWEQTILHPHVLHWVWLRGKLRQSPESRGREDGVALTHPGSFLLLKDILTDTG